MLEENIETLKSGGTLLYPSDTIWGIGCDATNDAACKKLIELKTRPELKSFIVLVDGFPMLEKIIPEFHEVCYELADIADKPLTIIYPNAKGVSSVITGEDGSLGIRITTDPICLKLIRSMRKPLVSTSANISGMPNPTCFDEIDEKIKSGVDGIVKERLTEKMISPSQIIKIDLNGSVKVIRG